MDTATLTQETTQIPVRALLAHAVRCARRVQPLFSIDPEHPEADELTAAVDLAIRLSEEFAAGKDIDPDLAAQAEDDAVRAILAASEGNDEQDGMQRSAYAANAAYAVIDATTEAMAIAHATEPSIVAENICNSVTIAIDAAFSAERSIESEARRDWQTLNELELGHFPELGEPVDPSESGILGPLFVDEANRPVRRSPKKRRTNKSGGKNGRHSAGTADPTGLTPQELELRARFLEAEQRLKDERERLKEERVRIEKQEEELIARMAGFDSERKEWDELRRDGHIDDAPADASQSELEQERKQLHSEQQILKFDQETIKADRDALEEARRDLETQMAELEALRASAPAELEPEAESLEEIESLRREVARLQQERDSAVQSHGQLQDDEPADSQQSSHEQQALQQKLAEAEAARAELERELSQAHEQCQAFELAAAELEAEREQLREAARRAAEAAENAAKARPTKRKKTGEETLSPEEIEAFHREADALEQERKALREERAVLTRQEAGIQKSLLDLKRSRTAGTTSKETGGDDLGGNSLSPERLGSPQLIVSGGPRYLPFDTVNVRDADETPSLFIVLKPGKATAVKLAEILHSLVMLFRQVGGTRLKYQVAGIRYARADAGQDSCDDRSTLVAIRTVAADESGSEQAHVDRAGWQRFSSCLFLSLKPRPGLAQRFEQGEHIPDGHELRSTLAESVKRVRQSFSSQNINPSGGLHIDSLNNQMRRVRELLEKLEHEFGTCVSVVPLLEVNESEMFEVPEHGPAGIVVVKSRQLPKKWMTGILCGRKGRWLLLGFTIFIVGYALVL